MWMKQFMMKNMTISDVQYKIMNETATYTATTSSKVAMDTGHRLSQLLEEQNHENGDGNTRWATSP